MKCHFIRMEICESFLSMRVHELQYHNPAAVKLGGGKRKAHKVLKYT